MYVETTKISEPGKSVSWALCRLREMSDLQMLEGFFHNPVPQWITQIQSRTAGIQAWETAHGLQQQTQDEQNLGIPETHHCLNLAPQRTGSQLQRLQCCVSVTGILGKQAAAKCSFPKWSARGLQVHVNAPFRDLPFHGITNESIVESVQEVVACISNSLDVHMAPASISIRTHDSMLESNMVKITYGISGTEYHFPTIALEGTFKSPLQNKVFPMGRHLLYFQYSLDEKMSSNVALDWIEMSKSQKSS